ncbi:MAG: DUF3899 domain-containing protein [Acholeplasma sp.]|nr:MAG: DUF3899 domain-containing protein [Acholeplasma sp.]
MKITRLILLYLSMLVLAFLVHMAVYRFDFNALNVSNALFVVGIILFLPSVVAITAAYEVFHGIRYVAKVILNPSFRKEYPQFKDYKDDKTGKVKTTVFFEILMASFILLVMSYIFSLVALSWMMFKELIVVFWFYL